jgi:hypothetical protein
MGSAVVIIDPVQHLQCVRLIRQERFYQIAVRGTGYLLFSLETGGRTATYGVPQRVKYRIGKRGQQGKPAGSATNVGYLHTPPLEFRDKCLMESLDMD